MHYKDRMPSDVDQAPPSAPVRTDWQDVEIVLADGSRRPAKAAYVGEGWCDTIVDHGDFTARLWVRADGSAELPMHPCRLAAPFAQVRP